MPKMDGVDVLEMALEIKPELTVIMISGHGNIETAVDCLKKGAYDYIAKPLDLHRLLTNVRNGLGRADLEQETKTLKRKLHQKKSSPILGESEAVKEMLSMIEKVAPTDARVLITGPNGSGKELVARQLHNLSERKKQPFVEVNCAAIPSELIESELFGHEKGAFTSAVKQRKGKFEQASGGTLFLDEIGDMAISAQAKVLRALQEHKITRVGGDKDIKVDVRVLAATNKNLKEEIEAQRFREDLYHRLSVILIQVPALSERADDIPILTEHFLNLASQEQGVAAKSIEKSAVSALQKLPWTGNIRELKNVCERLVILGDDPINKNNVNQYVRT
jgi:DNA-binding NtrC family response regulator